jgi:hypothetical protein
MRTLTLAIIAQWMFATEWKCHMYGSVWSGNKSLGNLASCRFWNCAQDECMNNNDVIYQRHTVRFVKSMAFVDNGYCDGFG